MASLTAEEAQRLATFILSFAPNAALTAAHRESGAVRHFGPGDRESGGVRCRYHLLNAAAFVCGDENLILAQLRVRCLSALLGGHDWYVYDTHVGDAVFKCGEANSTEAPETYAGAQNGGAE